MTPKPQRRRAGWIALAVLLVAGGGAALATVQKGDTPPPAPAAPPAMPVTVATVVAREAATWHEFSGRLEAVGRVELRSRAAGTVQAVHFREGALVRQGDLLFTIDPAPYAADAERADAQLAAARARVALARTEHERARRLWDERAIAQRELDERTQAVAAAEADVRAAEAALQSARLALSWTQVRAPIDGRIGRIEITAGNLVAAGPGAPVLTTLVSVHPIYASFDADEQVVARTLGARAALERVPVKMQTASGSPGADWPHAGRLQLVGNEVDAKSGTVRVRAVFDNKDGALVPGQFARLRMGQAQAETALLVDERAIGTDQNKRFVIVVDAQNQAQWREVKLGPPVDGMRVVSEGLKAGERIVVNGLQRVMPGATVAPREAAGAARAS